MKKKGTHNTQRLRRLILNYFALQKPQYGPDYVTSHGKKMELRIIFFENGKIFKYT